MSTFPEPTAVTFDDSSMHVALDDGRSISVPIAWYPKLMHATPEQRADCWLSPCGVHWDALDEDIAVEGMMSERLAQSSARRAA